MANGKPILPWVALLVLSVIILAGVMCYLELRDTRRYQPQIQENGFEVSVDVPCNRFHVLEIGLEIAPPVPVEKIEHDAQAVTGDVRLSSSKGESQEIHLDTTTSIMDGHKGVWIKTLIRQPARWRWKCGSSQMMIIGRNLNFDLAKHKVMVYVSRDRRY